MAWLKEHGYAAKSLGRRAVEKQLEKSDLSPLLRRVLELRLGGAKAAVNKFNAALVFAGDDDRIRGAFRFHGARTGRWSGLNFQPQNLKRPEVEDIDAAVAAVATGNITHMREKFEKPLAVLADVSHAMICAAPRCELIGADFASIEARVLAWLAGEDWKVDVFRRFDATGDFSTHPYVVAAAKALRLSPGTIKKGTENYHVGKVSELSFGYQEPLALGANSTSTVTATKRWSPSANPGAPRIRTSSTSGTRSVTPLLTPCTSAAGSLPVHAIASASSARTMRC